MARATASAGTSRVLASASAVTCVSGAVVARQKYPHADVRRPEAATTSLASRAAHPATRSARLVPTASSERLTSDILLRAATFDLERRRPGERADTRAQFDRLMRVSTNDIVYTLDARYCTRARAHRLAIISPRP